MTSHPRLRQDVVLHRISNRHESYVMVKDPVGPSYYKVEPWEADVMRLLDGTRDYETATREFDALHPDRRIDTQWMVDYVETLRLTGLIELPEQEKHLVMMDKLKELRKRRLINPGSSLFNIQIPLFDPDEAMNRVMPWIRWFWSPWVVVGWVAVFAVVLGFLIRHWDLYWTGFFGLFDVTRNTVWDWLALILLVFVVGIWHELGHGLSCKRFGGEVHDIGFVLFYFEPAFYCKIDDSYTFPRRAHRQAAVFGGPYFEMMLCSLAVATWLATPAEWRIHGLALTIVFITGISGLFNFNPLLKLDGYYAMMDWLGIPDLREESFEYTSNLLKRHVLRLAVPHKPIPRRRRRIYLRYGVVAILYTALVLLALYALARRWLVGWFGPLGYLILFALLTYLFRRRLQKAVGLMRHVWLDKREVLSRGGRPWLIAGALVVLALLLTLPRSPTRISATFVVEPGERAVVRAAAAGRVSEVAVAEGTRVEPGQVLAVLLSPDLAADYARASADVERGLRLAAGARSAGDVAAAAERGDEVGEARARRRMLDRKITRLALQAPIEGIVTTPGVELLRGRNLEEGDEFCTVDRFDTVLLAVTASEVDAQQVAVGTPLRLAAVAHPGRTLRAEVRSIAPLAIPPSLDEQARLDLVQRVNVVRVLVEIENPGGRLRPGMSGRVQFLTRSRSAAGKAWWGFRRWVASIVW